MKQITVNGKEIFEVDGNEVNGETMTADLVATGHRDFHVIHQGKSYQIEVVQVDQEQHQAKVRVNQTVYTLNLKDRMDIMLEQMGMGKGAAGKMKQLKSPMPGLVLDVRVKAGDVVQKGDAMIVLEAMKMENVLKAEGEGTVGKVLVSKGQNVEKGFVMITFN